MTASVATFLFSIPTYGKEIDRILWRRNTNVLLIRLFRYVVLVDCDSCIKSVMTSSPYCQADSEFQNLYYKLHLENRSP